jgi:hypothetical protein
MADERLARLFESLDTGFDAALARTEDEAATDLAMSLLQGRTLADVILREGSWTALLPGGVRVPVAAVGADFLVAGMRRRRVVPLSRATVASAPSGRTPQSIDARLLEVIRDLARKGTQVQVAADSGEFEGRLAAVGPDYLKVVTYAGGVLVGLGSVMVIAVEGGDGSL